MTTIDKEDWEVKKDEVIQQMQLLDVAQLGEVCQTASLVIPPSKTGDRSKIYNMILAHIISDEVAESGDHGLALFVSIENRIKGMSLKDVKTEDSKAMVTAMVTDSGSGSTVGLMNSNILANPSSSNNNSNQLNGNIGSGNNNNGGGSIDAGMRFHLQPTKLFTIHGGFVATGDSPISYSNLKYQLEDGRNTGYNDQQLMSGVMRAIKPNSNLREFLVSAGRLSLEDFLKHIKNHYKLTDSATMLTQLSGSVQAANQKVQDYVAQLGRLRNDIVTVSQEEGNPLDPAMVQRRFLHALSVGVRKNTIRLEIQGLLKNTEISDVELGEEIHKIAAREEEHEAKMDEGKNVSANALNVGEGNTQKIMAELARLSAKMNELSVSKSDEVLALKQQISELQNRLGALGESNWNQCGNQGYYYDDAGVDNSSFSFGYNSGGFPNGYDGFDGNFGYSNNSYGGYGNRGGGNSNRGGNNYGNRGGGNINRGGGNLNRGGSSASRGGGNFNRGGGNFKNRGGGNTNRGGGNFNHGNFGGMNNSFNNGGAKRGGFGGNRGGRGGSRGGFGGGRGGHGGNSTSFPKCEECLKTDAFCTHCQVCGASDHKRYDCPKNH